MRTGSFLILPPFTKLLTARTGVSIFLATGADETPIK